MSADHIHFFLQLRDQIKLYHWQTRVYARRNHKESKIMTKKSVLPEELAEQVEEALVAEKEMNITIKITNSNLSYKSDFTEPETVFWLEAIKDIIIKKTFQESERQS